MTKALLGRSICRDCNQKSQWSKKGRDATTVYSLSFKRAKLAFGAMYLFLKDEYIHNIRCIRFNSLSG